MERLETRDISMTRDELIEIVNTDILTNVQVQAYNLIVAYDVQSTYDDKRLRHAVSRFYNDYMRIVNGLNGSSGLAGSIDEILYSHDSDSTIKDLRDPTKNDNYVIVNGKRRKCEHKRNGGRIENMLIMPINQQRATYVVYRIDWHSQKRYRKNGTLAPIKYVHEHKIMTVYEFLNMLKECKAIREIEHKGTYDRERSIIVSNSDLHKALKQFRDFERNKTYHFE